MDKSVDSIGSCSLDVDADSTDFSDTSCSLGFLTPSSAKDLTNDFTAGIKERCKIPLITSQPATTIFNSDSGEVTTVLSSSVATTSNDEVTLSEAKKPSYLNLACCVNGYSNLTTYDSKLRQDINRSREVSPIRPLIHSLQFTKIEGGFNNTLTVPQMENQHQQNHHHHHQQQQHQYRSNSSSSTFTKLSNSSSCERERDRNGVLVSSGSSDVTDNVYFSNNENNNISIINNSSNNKKSSILQRVERLYGANSVTTQGFLTKSKSNDNKLLNSNNNNNSNYNSSATLFYNKHTNNNNNNFNIMDNENVDNSNTLPVLRHLNPEFRSQLKLLSPKKSNTSIGNLPNGNGIVTSTPIIPTATTIIQTSKPIVSDKEENNHYDSKILIKNNGDTSSSSSSVKVIKINSNDTNTERNNIINNDIDDFNLTSNKRMSTSNTISCENGKMPEMNNSQLNGSASKHEPQISQCAANTIVKDGKYFLHILETERERILSLAMKVEEDLNSLNPDEVGEEVLGYLRSASGKGRLLATKKMKQFEGLCYKNIDQVSDNGKFMTTDEDLQGFWDMLLLQVNDIDNKYREIELIKSNGWEKPKPPSPGPPNGAKLVRRFKAKPETSRNGSGAPSTAKTSSATVSAAALKREAQRKQLIELKKRNKLNQNNNNGVEFFVETS